AEPGMVGGQAEATPDPPERPGRSRGRAQQTLRQANPRVPSNKPVAVAGRLADRPAQSSSGAAHLLLVTRNMRDEQPGVGGSPAANSGRARSPPTRSSVPL